MSFIFSNCITVAYAANISFSGTIAIIKIDNGSGVYSGTTIGDVFSGNIIVGNSASDASSTRTVNDISGNPVSSEYTFSVPPYGIVIGNDGVDTRSSYSTVVIDDNYPAEIEGIIELNELFGTNLQPGTPLDAWAAFGHTDGAIVDMNDNLSDGLEFGILYGFDPTVYTGLDYRTTPPAMTNVSYGYFYISQSDASGNQIFYAFGTLDSSAPVTAEVSSLNVWLNRTRDESNNSTTYAFYTDVYGTVSEFKTIVLTSPLNNTYNLGLSPEGDQWGSGIEGTQSVIEAEFPDGTYTFTVTYTDDTTEEISVELSGDLPPYPENISVSNTQLSWDLWTSPSPLSSMEFVVFDSDDNFIERADLPAIDTSYTLTNNLMLDEKSYKVNVSFVNVTEASQYSAYKASSTTVITPTPIATDQKPSSGGGGGGSANYDLLLILLLGITFRSCRSFGKNIIAKNHKI